MVEVDEFDLMATAHEQRRGQGPRAPGQPTDRAWTWVGAGLTLVLLTLALTPWPLPPMTIGVLEGDLTQAPTQVWATPLPAVLADDTVQRDGHSVFTGSITATSGGERVVVVTGLLGVAGFEAESGAQLWEHEITGLLCQATVAVVCVHAASKWRASLSLIDPVSGVRVTYETPGAMRAVAVAAVRDALPAAPTIAVVGADATGTWVSVLDAAGTPRWRVQLHERIGSPSLQTAGGLLYVGGAPPSVIDAGTGEVLAHPAQVLEGPEGCVEVVDAGGRVSLVRPDGGVLRPGENVAPIAAQSVAPGWAGVGAIAASTVIDGALLGVTDDSLVRWEW